MDAPVPQTWAHRRWWRWLSRHISAGWAEIAVGALSVGGAIASPVGVYVALRTDRTSPWLVAAVRWGWLGGIMAGLPLMLLAAYVTRVRARGPSRPNFAASMAVSAAVAAALVAGRMPLAVLVAHGGRAIIVSVDRQGARSFRRLTDIAGCVAVFAAALAGWAWMAGVAALTAQVVALLVTRWDHIRPVIWPRLTGALAGKTSLDAYVSRARQSCPIGGG